MATMSVPQHPPETIGEAELRDTRATQEMKRVKQQSTYVPDRTDAVERAKTASAGKTPFSGAGVRGTS